MDYKIGIICAGDREVEPFLPWISECTISEKAMLKFYAGTIEDQEIVTLFSGVCKTNAAIATQILIDTYGCNVIINAGTAGGISKEIKLFDTVVSTETAYWDVSEEILTEFHPWMESIYFKADQTLIDLTKKAVSEFNHTRVYFGRLITGESFIEDNNRTEINQNFSPLSVDMETASIAHVCYVNQIPFIAIRTITDSVDHIGADEFEINCCKASQLSAQLVKDLLKELSNLPQP